MALFIKNGINFLFILSFGLATAQEKFDFDELLKKYPNEKYLFLNESESFKIELKSGKLDITSTSKQQVLHLSDLNSLSTDERTVSYLPGKFDLKSLEAATYIPNNGSYKKASVKTFKEEGMIDDGIFFDDLKVKKFTFPSIQKGAFTYMEYEYNYVDPNNLGSFYFGSGSPILQSFLEVEFPKDVNLGYYFHGDSSAVKFTKTEQKNKFIYKWEVRDFPAVKAPEHVPSSRYYYPHIFIYIKSYKGKNGEEVKLLNDVGSLFKMMYSKIKNTNSNELSNEIKFVADSIKNATQNESDLAKNIFYWVKDHVKYIAFEDGEGGHVPREANEVFNKKYGDCKDYSSLITAMLNYVGIKSYLTWIGTDALPYSFYKFPSPYNCNHMIAAVKQNNDWIFLDGTSKNTAFGYPSISIQNKEALIAIDSNNFEIVKVNPIKMNKNTRNHTIQMTISKDSEILASGDLKANGYLKSTFSDMLYYLKPKDKDEKIKNYLKTGNNKCNIESYELIGLENRDEELNIKYKLSLKDYAKEIDNKKYISLNLNKDYGSYAVDTTGQRKASSYFRYEFDEHNTYILNIPEGYQLKKIPKNIAYDSDLFYHSQTYSVKDDKIILEEKFILKTIEIESKHFDEWNKQMDKINKSYKELIVLEKR